LTNTLVECRWGNSNFLRSEVEERYYTVKQVADTLNVSPMTIYRMIQDGTMKAVRISHTYRIPASAVDDYLAANAVN